ncbi:thioredoxin family protein [Smaragdicoccus niigatensis]|uniref:thioredoxin family protein n=1 Tax=Smaragdicoccus niigatensis TaxID=359359 RepID=UPI00037A103D|nr:thioredoxin family protein [Smaragdicoccus niigatensis]
MAVTSTMLPLGTTAPGFALPDPTGHTWSLTDIQGENGTLVAFVCNHCPYVKHIGNDFGRLASEWHSAGIGVVAINSNNADAYPDDAPINMPAAAAEWGWRFPYLIDEDQSAAIAYQAACTPEFYLFDRDLELVYRGRFDESTPRNGLTATGDELTAAVTALLSGEPISGEQHPSIGCNIKWKPGNAPGWFSLLK